ncbi:MAG: PPOX class F420-dependent oxidoreductase [Mycobacteriaceae bacterium]
MANVATSDTVSLDELLDFVRPRHQAILVTTRSDARPQLSPVSCGVDPQGRIVVATYPQRAKTTNARKRPQVSLCILGQDFNDAWVQVDGDCEVLDMPEAAEAFVDYYRSISGEHPDWDAYRTAMREQDKALLRITPTRWGPVATGGFPPEVAARMG